MWAERVMRYGTNKAQSFCSPDHGSSLYCSWINYCTAYLKTMANDQVAGRALTTFKFSLYSFLLGANLNKWKLHLVHPIIGIFNLNVLNWYNIFIVYIHVLTLCLHICNYTDYLTFLATPRYLLCTHCVSY